MRRCELADVRRDLLDLAAGTLEIDVTRAVVDGKVIESDGKTENAQHVLALDPFIADTGMPSVQYLGLVRTRAGQLLAQAPLGSSYPCSLAAATERIAERLARDDPAAAQLAWTAATGSWAMTIPIP